MTKTRLFFFPRGKGGGFFFLLALLTVSPSAWSQTVLRGADVSFLPQVERNGGRFRDERGVRDGLSILFDQGFTFFRLRIWHTPPDGANNLTETLALARRIHAMGGSLLLDFHYSDTWADPGQQRKPLAWNALPLTQLADSVETYTEHVLRALADQGTLPIAVQLGNEITSGLLWPDGHVGGSSDRETQWANLRLFLERGARAVRRVQNADSPIAIVLHIDRGGSWADTQWWFDALGPSIDFDWIGLSYYPWWHGSWANFLHTLTQTSQRYGKGVLVAETAYPWTTRWYDNTHNLVGDGSPLLPEFPTSPEGQRSFLRAMDTALQADPRGIGWVYWAPDWISTPSFGSAWENLALFDFSGVWLHQGLLSATSATPSVPLNNEIRLWPHPAHNEVHVQCPAHLDAHVSIWDALGREVLRTRVTEEYARIATQGWPRGVYAVVCADGAVRSLVLIR